MSLRRAALAAGLTVLLATLVSPAQADFFKWVDRQFTEEADAQRIMLVEPGVWVPAATEETLSSSREGNASAKQRFLSEEEKNYERRYRDGNADSSPQTVAVEEISVVPDGLTALRMRNAGLVPDRRLKRYLDGIAERLLANSPKTAVPFDMRITGNRDIGSASALQDGVIGIPLGVLQVVETEDELAFLIGHELSHVILGHHDSDWLADNNKRLVSIAEIGIETSFVVAQKFGANLNENQIRWINFAASQASLFLSDDLLTSSWSREDETEADELGLDLMIAAGYDPNEAFTLLDRMLLWEESLPTPEERRAKQRAAMEAQINESGQQGDFSAAMEGAMQGVATELIGLFQAIGGGSHPDTEGRIDHLADYLGKFYAELEERAPRDGDWMALRNSRTTKSLIKNYQQSWQIIGLLDAGNIDKAARLAGGAVSGPTKTHALPRMNFARVRKFQGNQGKARANLRLGIQGDEPTLVLYKWAVIEDLNQNKRISAFKTLDEAWTRFKQPPELYPLKIYKAVMEDNRQEASRLTRTCRVIFRDKSKSCLSANNGELEMDWN